MTRPSPLSRDCRAHAVRRGAVLCVALAAAFAAPIHAATDLTSLSLEQLLEVTIVGASKYEQKQSEVGAAVSVITRREIKAFGWRTLDQALASLPGVHTTYDRQYSYLGTRGFGLPGDYNTRVLVTINGNRVNDASFDSGPPGIQFPLDLDLVERIEFIPGPGGAVYGQNAMFGVVNVVTRDGASFNGAELAAARQQPQRLREGRATWGRRLDNGVDMLLSASRLRARGEDHFFDFGAAGVSGVAAGMDGESDKEFFVRAARGPWSLDVVYGDRRKDDPTASFFSDPLAPGQYQRKRYALAHWQHEQSLGGDDLHLLTRLFVGQHKYNALLVYGTAYDYPSGSDWRGGELRLLSTAWDGHKLMAGLELQDNAHIDLRARDLATPANDITVRTSGWRHGFYLQDEWQASDTLSTTIGLRVDRDSATGANTSPRFALIWRATASTAVKALYGRAHRAPNAYERDWGDGISQVSNRNLGGECIDTLELVADHRVGPDLALRASVYRWSIRDLITLGIDPVSGLTQYQSGEKVKAQGLELSADKTWTSGARLRGSVSLQDATQAGHGELLNSPKLLAKMNLSAPLPWAGLRAGYEWRYDAKRLSLDGSKLGGYALSNLHLSTEALAKGLELSLTVQNLFDKRYAHPGADTNWQNALEQDGRSVGVKFLYAF